MAEPHPGHRVRPSRHPEVINVQLKWEPYIPKPDISVWVQESSCCGVFTLLHEGREGVVTRWVGGGRRMETGRGSYLKALIVWKHLAGCHRRHHEKQKQDKRQRRVAS